MPARKHVLILKPFDQYDVFPGAKTRAVLSQSGFDRISDKRRGWIELEASFENGRLTVQLGKDTKELSAADSRQLIGPDGKLVDNFAELAKKLPAFKDRADRDAGHTRAG